MSQCFTSHRTISPIPQILHIQVVFNLCKKKSTRISQRSVHTVLLNRSTNCPSQTGKRGKKIKESWENRQDRIANQKPAAKHWKSMRSSFNFDNFPSRSAKTYRQGKNLQDEASEKISRDICFIYLENNKNRDSPHSSAHFSLSISVALHSSCPHYSAWPNASARKEVGYTSR